MPNNEKTAVSSGDSRPLTISKRIAEMLEFELSRPLAPGLYLVSTPIGNLSDMSLRALVTLEKADLVFCEDTRHSRKLFTHFGISRDTHAYHDHNAARVRPRILARVKAGQSVAIISDAGTPLISDPGNKLVREAREAGLPVFAIPGASAALAALTISGLPTDRFFFEGFLPPKTAARKKRLTELKGIPATLIFYEAPSRVPAMLDDLASVLGARQGVVAKELTKLHEGTVCGTLAELAESAAGELGEKGEFVVMAGPPVEVEVDDDAIVSALETALQEEASFRDAVQEVTQAFGLPRNRVYKLALALRDGAS